MHLVGVVSTRGGTKLDIAWRINSTTSTSTIVSEIWKWKYLNIKFRQFHANVFLALLYRSGRHYYPENPEFHEPMDASYLGVLLSETTTNEAQRKADEWKGNICVICVGPNPTFKCPLVYPNNCPTVLTSLAKSGTLSAVKHHSHGIL